LILEGSVEIMHKNELLCVKGKGDFFGLSAVENGVHQTTAVAQTPVVCLVLTELKIEKYFRKHNPDKRDLLLPLMGAEPCKHLSKIDLFRDVSPENLNVMGILLRHIALDEGEVLFVEGSIGNQMYIIQQGSVKAVHNEEGKEVLLRIQRGRLFWGD